jgi:exopolyphosphatase/guanosine-5'-triphosphate,3'-diphosphate pyrophosphatase
MVLQANLEERMNIPGLDRERADIIPAGLSIIKTLMQLIRSNTLIISGNGLREGVFFKQCLDSGDGTKGVVKDVLYHSVNNILKNYEMNRDHCYHVQKLALALFDQTARLHNMGAAERKILATGALLHDIGVYVNYYNHHKHGFYLVLNSRLNGLTNKELVMCAYIVAMHTNEDLKQTWHLYGSLLDKADRETIKRLSLFVRIAEQLDRSEYGSVADLVCQVSAEQVQVMVRTKNHPELEIAEALKCRKHFEKLLKRKLGIVKN